MGESSNFQFECYLHIAIIHFDEVLGPQLLQIYPEMQIEREDTIRKILQQLIDVGSIHDRREWEFVYSDRYFSSLNVYLTIPNPNSRGGGSDFMISLIVSPTYSQIVSAMVMDWNSLYEIKMNCMDLLTTGSFQKTLSQTLEEVKFILATNIDMIRNNLNSQLEALNQGSFVFL